MAKIGIKRPKSYLKMPHERLLNLFFDYFSMIIALPMDSQNYESRLDWLEYNLSNYPIGGIEYRPWPSRDDDEWGGSHSSYLKAAKYIGEKLGGLKDSGILKENLVLQLRMPYIYTAHPKSIPDDWVRSDDTRGLRKGFRESNESIEKTLEAARIIKERSGCIHNVIVSYHDQMEMDLTSGRRGKFGNLINLQDKLYELTFENAKWLKEKSRDIIGPETRTAMENTSFHPWEMGSRIFDETGYIEAEMLGRLGDYGVGITLDPGHVVLQLLEIGKAEPPMRLQLLKERYNGVPPSMVEPPSEGQYTLSNYVDVLGSENLLSLDLTQVNRLGQEGHDEPWTDVRAMENSLVDYRSLLSIIPDDTFVVPEASGGHKDPEGGGINHEVLVGIEFLSQVANDLRK
jgi:hypothetical protein